MSFLYNLTCFHPGQRLSGPRMVNVGRFSPKNYANCVRLIDVTKTFPFFTDSPPPPSDTETRNAYTVPRFVMMLAQVTLFHAVTPA